MAVRFLRPKGLGKTSVEGIVSKMVSDAEVVRSDKQLEAGPMGDGTLIRWGSTGKALVKPGAEITLVNPLEAIRETSDKLGSREVLAEVGLAPMTWLSLYDLETSGYAGKVVVRPARHKQGKHLYLCETFSDVVAATQKVKNELNLGYYISEYIKKEKEFRVLVAEGRAVYVYEKIPEDASAAAWNHAWGSEAPNVKWGQWDLNVVGTAISSMGCFDLTFGAVDVMVKDGVAYTLEINTAPETTSEYRQSCLAKVFDMIVERDGKVEMDSDVTEGWRGVIHPAIFSGANSTGL